MPPQRSWYAHEYRRQRGCCWRSQQKFKKKNPEKWDAFCLENKPPENWRPPQVLRTICSWPRKPRKVRISCGYSSFTRQENEDKPFFKSLNNQYKKETAENKPRGMCGRVGKISACGFLFKETILECSWMLVGGMFRQPPLTVRIYWYEQNGAWLDTPLHFYCWLSIKRKEKLENTALNLQANRQKDAAKKKVRWKTDSDYRKLMVKKRRLHREANRTQSRLTNKLYREIRRQDPGIRLKQNARSRFGKVMKRVKLLQTTDSFNNFIGCSSSFLRQHIESQFEPWMNWDNYGPSWQMDHKKPLKFFNLFDQEQAKSAFHFSNLKPVSAAYNASKQARWIDL